MMLLDCSNFLLIFAIATSEVFSENILILHPVYAGSHILVIRRIMEHLLLKGHKIKVIRWKESSNIPVMVHNNVSETVLGINNIKGTVPFMTQEENARFIFPGKHMWERGLKARAVFDGGMATVAASCEALFQEKQLLQELRRTKFKVAIVDLIYNECGLALAFNLSVPAVGYWGVSFISGETQYTTAFNTPASIPHQYIPFTDQMNFFERVANFVFGFGSHLVMQVHFYATNYYIQKYLENTPHPSELLANISGILINSHQAYDFPRQLPPTFLQIGGFHIRKPQPLPKDLKEFVEGSKHGVILLSLGKNFDSELMPQEVYNAYFNAFRRLKQRVIVKSNTVPENLPQNVKVFSYVPQADILAHEKTILFLTHCGMHGVMEAIHYGVKMVAIPIFFDQGNVAVRLVDQGVAISLSKTATEEDIYDAMITVISEERYERNIKRISSLYHSSFENPLEKAVWLIEHIMETNGANYLKLSAKNLHFVQYFCLDVILFLALLLIVVGFFVYRSLMCIGRGLGKISCFRWSKKKTQ